MSMNTVFEFFRSKVKKQCYTSGPGVAARNLRKQGVPFDIAYFLIFDQQPRKV